MEQLYATESCLIILIFHPTLSDLASIDCLFWLERTPASSPSESGAAEKRQHFAQDILLCAP